jgi:hypothetical protein
MDVANVAVAGRYVMGPSLTGNSYTEAVSHGASDDRYMTTALEALDCIATDLGKCAVLDLNMIGVFNINAVNIRARQLKIAKCHVAFAAGCNGTVNRSHLYGSTCRCAGAKVHVESVCCIVVIPFTFSVKGCKMALCEIAVQVCGHVGFVTAEVGAGCKV